MFMTERVWDEIGGRTSGGFREVGLGEDKLAEGGAAMSYIQILAETAGSASRAWGSCAREGRSAWAPVAHGFPGLFQIGWVLKNDGSERALCSGSIGDGCVLEFAGLLPVKQQDSSPRLGI
jgi:hypothetical protein